MENIMIKKKNSSNNEAYFKWMGKEKIVAWIIFAFFAIYSLTLIYPIFWIFLNSLKTEQAFTYDFNGLPKQLYFTNYKTALLISKVNETNMLGMFGNSIFLSTISTLLTVFFSSCTAYILAKFNFKLKNIIYTAVIFSMILPIVGTMPAMLRLFKDIFIYDTPIAVLFIYSGGFGTNFLLLYSFFKNLSWGYAEAAQIDGASDFRIFISIMLPIALPAVISVAVLTWIGLWNEYVIPRIFLPSMPTISVGLFDITEQLKKSSNYTLMFAAVILALIPIIFVFSIFQKTIMTNTVAGGLKG